MANKLYITTPIYYPNSDPHIGTAYTTIIADSLARFYKQKGINVLFVTGNDENSLKVEESAQKINLSTKDYVDKMADLFKQIWQKLNISYDKFIRTTDSYHIEIVNYVFTKLFNEKYIYKSYYEGWYCKYCETFWPKSKVKEDKKCPNIECQRELSLLQEESYFFKLSIFQQKLINFYKEHKDVIFPETRYNEVISFLEMGLQDLSITRKNLKWGIKVPFDNEYTIYVWFDALLNYISALNYPNSFQEEYWNNCFQIMGKDIIRFHAIIWPSILMALKLNLPKKIIAHGWLVNNYNEKISKSKGGDPFNLKQFLFNNPDNIIMALRYYLLKEGSFGEDIPISYERFINIYNADLANNFGNLVSRISVFIQKNLDSLVTKKSKIEFLELLVKDTIKKIDYYMERLDFQKVLESILNFANFINKKIEETKPWTIKEKEKLNEIMFEFALSLIFLARFLYPFTPSSSEKIVKQLSLSEDFITKDNYLKEIWSLDSIKISTTQTLFPVIKKVET